MNEELAWAAGFFDGEGSVFRATNVKHYKCGYQVQASVSQSGDRELLDRFQRAVGVGSVYGPFRSSVKGKIIKPRYRWVATGMNVQKTLDLLWPWLGSIKKSQASRVLGKE